MEIVVFSREMQFLSAAAAGAVFNIYIARRFDLEICSEKTDKKHGVTSVYIVYMINRRNYLVKNKRQNRAVKFIFGSTIIRNRKRQIVPFRERGGEKNKKSRKVWKCLLDPPWHKR